MVVVRVPLVVAALVAVVAACGSEEVTRARPLETQIAFTASLRGPWATWVVRADGSGFARFSEPQRRSRRTELGPVWSPDGSRLAFSAHRNRYGDGGFVGGGADYDIYVMDRRGGHATNVTAGPRIRDAGHFDWSPDATRIVVDGWDEQRQHHRLYVVHADESGKVAELTDGRTDDAAPSWSPDGRRIAFLRDEPGATDAINTVAPDGEGVRRLVASNTTAAWSPDGKRIAFTRGGRRAALFVADARGQRETKLTATPGDLPVVWSSDGDKIAYNAYRAGGWDIYVVDVRSGRRARLTDNPGDEVSPVWAPHGTKVAFSHSPAPIPAEGSFDIYLMNADGSGKRRLTDCRCVAGGGLSWQRQSLDP